MGSAFDDAELSMDFGESTDIRSPPPSHASQARQPPAHRDRGQSSRRPTIPAGRQDSMPGESGAEQRIGQYSVKKTLGEGSFGKVKLAVHRISGQEVALKIISRKKLISRDMAGRVEREIQYLQLLRHPHIIKL
jgi:carbon catabolite-derepressing protein kinase